LANERLSMAQQAAGFGIWDNDLRTGVAVWDEQALRNYGLPLQPGGLVSQQTRRSMVHPDDLPAEPCAPLEDGPSGERDYRIVRPNGEVRYMHSAWRVLFDDRGMPVRAVGIDKDVTERQVLIRDLAERVRELQVLREASRILQADHPFDQVLCELA